MPKMTQLKATRRGKGIMSKQIAAALAITEQYYCEIENERRLPSFKLARRISELLNVPLGQLFPAYNVNTSLHEQRDEKRTALNPNSAD